MVIAHPTQERKWIMRKLMMSALLLVSAAGLPGSVQAEERAHGLREVRMEAPSIAHMAGPFSITNAQTVASDLIRRGFHFIRYEQDSSGDWWVVYTR
jgi:hypothetical protein